MSLFFREIFSSVKKNKVHSVTIGNFRMANNYLKRMIKINPTDPYILEKYISEILPNRIENSIKPKMDKIKEKISKFVDESKIFVN